MPYRQWPQLGQGGQLSTLHAVTPVDACFLVHVCLRASRGIAALGEMRVGTQAKQASDYSHLRWLCVGALQETEPRRRVPAFGDSFNNRPGRVEPGMRADARMSRAVSHRVPTAHGVGALRPAGEGLHQQRITLPIPLEADAQKRWWAHRPWSTTCEGCALTN